MKKIFKKEIIISFIVGLMIASGIVYAATSASQITYKDGKTVEYALNDLYSKVSAELTNISSSNVSIEQNQTIDNTVSKIYTATQDELITVCVSETGDSRYTNEITTTGTIISDSNNLNTKTWAPEINRDWYINIRTAIIKLEKDDTVTISC